MPRIGAASVALLSSLIRQSCIEQRQQGVGHRPRSESRYRWLNLIVRRHKMTGYKAANPARAFDRAYINGQFVTPHGTQIVDLVNPTNNTVIGKVTMADEIDTQNAIAAAKEAFNTFSQSSKEYRMDCLQRLHDAVAKRMDQLVDATVLEYGAPQDRAKGSNNLAAKIFLTFQEVPNSFDFVKTFGKSSVVLEAVGVVGIFTPWNSSAGSI